MNIDLDVDVDEVAVSPDGQHLEPVDAHLRAASSNS